ncbi:uncharacterized protein TNCV_3549191 [Trichonephila clavipes]|nr:uncharacterized protein TNCV_3549191 [Trichonephila clavipes]
MSWRVDKLLRDSFLRQLISRMSISGTFWEPRRPTNMWKVRLTRTIAVFGLVQVYINSYNFHYMFCMKRFGVALMQSSLCVCLFFFENLSTTGLVTGTVTGTCEVSLLEQFVIRALQAKRCDITAVFMQDSTPPHIARCVKQVLHCHFGDDGIISRHFLTTSHPRSLDLNNNKHIMNIKIVL